MGELDCPYWNHDPELKWSPLVGAATTFLEASSSWGLSASMTLFPAKSEECDAAQYEEPDVGMTELPSSAFRATLVEYEDEIGLAEYSEPVAHDGGGDWRDGTPSEAVVRGTTTFLDQLRSEQESTEALFATVLITDGMPSGCGDEDEHFQATIEAVEQGLENGFPTYVIGVRQPPLPENDAVSPWEQDGQRVWACRIDEDTYHHDYENPEEPFEPPDNSANLNAIAAAGGTEQAYMIDTGDPDATREALQEVVRSIRTEVLPCSFDLPATPPDRQFEKDNIDINAHWDDVTTRLAYEPECEPGSGWHYEEGPESPAIVLCEETCDELKGARQAELVVDFLCEPRAESAK